jgi:hypothetical protein
MSDNTHFGFAKLVPGFDFLQNLAKGASQSIPQMPSLSNWVAPTLNVEELEKRISELKAVHFWLDANGKALGATIQALEVQKMTLATLQGMNFNMGEVANALKLKTAETVTGGAQKVAEAAGTAAGTVAGAADGVRQKVGAKKSAGGSQAKGGNGAGAAPVDPLQWWGALTQQFQEIAAHAMKDVAQKTAVDAGKNVAAGGAKDPVKAAKTQATRKSAARKRSSAKT